MSLPFFCHSCRQTFNLGSNYMCQHCQSDFIEIYNPEEHDIFNLAAQDFLSTFLSKRNIHDEIVHPEDSENTPYIEEVFDDVGDETLIDSDVHLYANEADWEQSRDPNSRFVSQEIEEILRNFSPCPDVQEVRNEMSVENLNSNDHLLASNSDDLENRPQPFNLEISDENITPPYRHRGRRIRTNRHTHAPVQPQTATNSEVPYGLQERVDTLQTSVGTDIPLVYGIFNELNSSMLRDFVDEPTPNNINFQTILRDFLASRRTPQPSTGSIAEDRRNYALGPELDDILARILREEKPKYNPASEDFIKGLKKQTALVEGHCSICMCKLKIKDEYYEFKCGHLFHCFCASGWLKLQNTCPNCRSGLDE